jgi:hypothetical protein
MTIYLGHAVGAARIKGSRLILRGFPNLAEHLAAAGLVEARPGAGLADGVQQASDTHGSELGCQHRLLPAGGHEGHGGQVIDFLRLHLFQNPGDGGMIEKIALVKLNSPAKVFNPLKALRAGSADHAAHPVSLVQEKLREVTSVLSSDSGNESRFRSHGWPRLRERLASRNRSAEYLL